MGIVGSLYSPGQRAICLKEVVSWVYGGRDSHRYGSLFSYIVDFQNHISERHRFSSPDEISAASEILSFLRDKIIDDYFNNRINWLVENDYPRARSEHLFCLLVVDYLSHYQDADYFMDRQLCSGPTQDFHYGFGYNITKFGFAFFRLYYICYAVCSKDKILSQNGKTFIACHKFENILDSGFLTDTSFVGLFSPKN